MSRFVRALARARELVDDAVNTAEGEDLDDATVSRLRLAKAGLHESAERGPIREPLLEALYHLAKASDGQLSDAVSEQTRDATQLLQTALGVEESTSIQMEVAELGGGRA